MILGVGVDIIEIERVEKAICSDRFCIRVYTEAERAYALKRKNNAEAYAGIFAAKEAVAKALGSGLSGFTLQDIEVLHAENGAPYVELFRNAKAQLAELGAKNIRISIAHDRGSAVAMAIIES